MDIRTESDGVRRSPVPAAEGHHAFFAMLEKLSADAMRVLNKGDATAEEMQQLSGYVGEIRQLLVELCRLQATLPRSSAPAGAPCGALADRYYALEGMVKELRNDIMRRESRGPAPDNE